MRGADVPFFAMSAFREAALLFRLTMRAGPEASKNVAHGVSRGKAEGWRDFPSLGGAVLSQDGCYRDASASVTKPRIRNTIPPSIKETGLLPAPFHSPVAKPHTLEVMMMTDMKSGQPRMGPSVDM